MSRRSSRGTRPRRPYGTTVRWLRITDTTTARRHTLRLPRGERVSTLIHIWNSNVSFTRLTCALKSIPLLQATTPHIAVWLILKSDVARFKFFSFFDASVREGRERGSCTVGIVQKDELDV